MFSIPAHKQTNPSAFPGQRVNPVPLGENGRLSSDVLAPPAGVSLRDAIKAQFSAEHYAMWARIAANVSKSA